LSAVVEAMKALLRILCFTSLLLLAASTVQGQSLGTLQDVQHVRKPEPHPVIPISSFAGTWKKTVDCKTVRAIKICPNDSVTVTVTGINRGKIHGSMKGYVIAIERQYLNMKNQIEGKFILSNDRQSLNAHWYLLQGSKTDTCSCVFKR
jgi:hypothetical protein